uniref:Uncharacterized protein n=1 Tax=Setaria digitata TaxID=48799 RepID=A0A915PJZ0_9BILA
MAKLPKSRSSAGKKSSSKSPRSKDSSPARGQFRKTSRSRSRSRSTHSGSRSRSSSRGRGSTSSKKKTVSPTVKKFDDSAMEVKKIAPIYRISKNGSSYKTLPFMDRGLRRRTLATRVLQPLNLNNLKVKGAKLKHRFFSHCKRLSRYYTILFILGLIALGIFYTGYTIDQMAKYARENIKTITTYVQTRI